MTIGYVHNNKHPIKLSDFPRPQDARTDAPDQQDDRRLRRHPHGDAAASRGRGGVQGRGRWLRRPGKVPAVKLHGMKYHSETDKSPALAVHRTLFIVAMNPAKYDSRPPDDLNNNIDANSGADFSASIGWAWDVSAPPAREEGGRARQPFAMISATSWPSGAKVTDKLAAGWVKGWMARGYGARPCLIPPEPWIQKYNAHKMTAAGARGPGCRPLCDPRRAPCGDRDLHAQQYRSGDALIRVRATPDASPRLSKLRHRRQPGAGSPSAGCRGTARSAANISICRCPADTELVRWLRRGCLPVLRQVERRTRTVTVDFFTHTASLAVRFDRIAATSS